MAKLKLTLLFLLIFTQTLRSQDGAQDVLVTGLDDATKLLQGYYRPAMEGSIYSINNGWAHTAETHKPFGFDFTLGVSGAIVPVKRQFFKVTGLTKVNQNEGGVYEGPTVVSSQPHGNFLKVISSDGFSLSVRMPGGTEMKLPFNATPAPLAQLTLGLPYKTEILFRYLPKINIVGESLSYNLIGFGLKKEITDWFGEFNLPLHISLLTSITSFNVNYRFANLNSEILSTENGAADFNLNSYNFQSIFSLNYSKVNFYGIVGYGSGNSNFHFEGRFIYDKGGPDEQDYDTPILNFKSGSMKATLGTRFDFNFVKIFADFTLQKYNTISTGIIFSVN
ncbi:DUF6588 family protein [Polaribacter sargassicola]|uniref:DUF6588 family protein n=1 Tax=Polaribacter sargassicola TaxID=2836891 RepID=UPI001F3E100D|nr:DUF6588 family protein [Polaribacter sp. DS7-9]MCG1035854.1 hypothetical protein [Polaribacter sp. DS7-9]